MKMSYENAGLSSSPLAPYLCHPAMEGLCRYNQRLWVSTRCHWLAESKPLSHLPPLLLLPLQVQVSIPPQSYSPSPSIFPPPLLARKGRPILKQISVSFGLCQSFPLPGLQALSLPCSRAPWFSVAPLAAMALCPIFSVQSKPCS